MNIISADPKDKEACVYISYEEIILLLEWYQSHFKDIFNDKLSEKDKNLNTELTKLKNQL